MIEVWRAKDRGLTKNNWLHGYHVFAFGEFRNPDRFGFSDLLVLNHDTIAPDGGFAAHPHDNMEIFTYVLSGTLEHKDSMGNGSLIKAGELQMMSAGTGIRHSEFNPSSTEPVTLLQFWIVPNKASVQPRYQQMPLGGTGARFAKVISPRDEQSTLNVYQDTAVWIATLVTGESVTHKLDPKRFGFLYIASGEVTVNGKNFAGGDSLKLKEEPSLVVEAFKNATLLFADLRPNERPTRI